jgi:hypothetical protein
MAVREKTDVELAGELDAIATAAADRLRAQTDSDAEREVELQRTVGDAATRAIAAGPLPVAEIAEAERIGQRRGRGELGAEVLRRVERAARRKRGADSEYEQAVVRAGRLGLAQRDVAVAAGVAHGTVRAILARTATAAAQRAAATTTAAIPEDEPGRHSADASRLVDWINRPLSHGTGWRKDRAAR